MSPQGSRSGRKQCGWLLGWEFGSLCGNLAGRAGVVWAPWGRSAVPGPKPTARRGAWCCHPWVEGLGGAERVWAGHQSWPVCGHTGDGAWTLSALGCAWEPQRGLRPRVLGAGGQGGSPCPGRWGRAQGTAGHGAGQGAERGPGAPRPPPPAPRPAPAAAAACQGWRGGGGGGRRGKDGGRSARVMLHAHSPSPPESPTRRAPSSPSAVPGCRRGGCSEGPRPRAALSPGPPPAAGGRPAGPEPPGPGRRGSAEA